MKPLSFLILIMCVNFSLKSQNSHISVDNPSPRQFQNTTITIEIPFNDDFLKRQLDQNFDFYSGSGFKFTRIVTPNDTGLFKVGPYIFTINDKKYESDSVFIKVIPALEAKEGVYISTRSVDNKTIVIIEQVYKISSQNGSTNIYSSRYVEKDLVDLNLDYRSSRLGAELTETFLGPLRIDQIKKVKNPMGNNKNNFDLSSLQYSLKTYVITNYNDKAVKLTKENFINLPPNYTLPDILIK